jgi:hypothetical protein
VDHKPGDIRRRLDTLDVHVAQHIVVQLAGEDIVERVGDLAAELERLPVRPRGLVGDDETG